MRRKQVRWSRGFRVAASNRRSQAATMVLDPGQSEGGTDNRHRGADQWLYVVSGTGCATINGHTYPLRAGTLLLIGRNGEHVIKSKGRRPLRTLNLYVPPAYTRNGDALPRGRP